MRETAVKGSKFRSMDTDAGIGQQIMQRRKGHGIDQAALARMAGLSRNALAAIESGEAHPRDSTVKKLTDALDKFEGEVMREVPEDDDGGKVTFKVDGNFGVRVTVQGPVENVSELREEVSRLIESMEGRRGE